MVPGLTRSARCVTWCGDEIGLESTRSISHEPRVSLYFGNRRESSLGPRVPPDFGPGNPGRTLSARTRRATLSSVRGTKSSRSDLPPPPRHTASSGKSSGRCAGVRSLTCSCGCRVFVTSNHLTGIARRLPFSPPPAPVRLSNLQSRMTSPVVLSTAPAFESRFPTVRGPGEIAQAHRRIRRTGAVATSLDQAPQWICRDVPEFAFGRISGRAAASPGP